MVINSINETKNNIECVWHEKSYESYYFDPNVLTDKIDEDFSWWENMSNM